MLAGLSEEHRDVESWRRLRRADVWRDKAVLPVHSEKAANWPRCTRRAVRSAAGYKLAWTLAASHLCKRFTITNARKNFQTSIPCTCENDVRSPNQTTRSRGRCVTIAWLCDTLRACLLRPRKQLIFLKPCWKQVGFRWRLMRFYYGWYVFFCFCSESFAQKGLNKLCYCL